MSLFKITPEYLTSYINFHFSNTNWKFDWNENDNIAKLQAAGAAKAFNLLIDNNIALIADEVGMGKTYEALAVMTSLWKQKPDAKILLYAPNEIVAKKWINEYNNFILKNYTDNDDLVKSSINNEALHKAVYCNNHIELMQNINKKWVSFFVCKTSSLSGFLSPKMNNETFDNLNLNLKLEINDNSSYKEKAQWMYKLAKRCNERAYEVLSTSNKPPFDLIVFDEAHYLRRTDARSKTNRSIVANAFFARRNIIKEESKDNALTPIASKVLLMTATPNHSSEQDVMNMVSLFNNSFSDTNANVILNNICIRRFRRLNNKVKYEYREEIPEGVKLKTLKEKLFFATYHKSLVLNKAKEANKKHGQNAYKVLFGYLEGFEYFSNNETEKSDTTNRNDRESLSGDYDNAEDSNIIKDLSKIYKNVYGENPAHPKYERIIDDLMNKNNEGILEKKLVFVRRIPSVNEIASRLVEKYDELFKGELKDIVDDTTNNKDLRKFFYNEIRNESTDKNNEISEIDTTDIDEEENEDLQGIPKSELLNLFTVKKKGDYKSTDCSNFRLRFKKDSQIFSIFFQPASDYSTKSYNVNGFIYNDNKRQYYTTIKILRLSNIDYKEKIKLDTKQTLKDIKKISSNLKLETLLSLWRKKTTSELKKAQDEYDNFSYIEKEGFSNYLEAGILFASPYIFKFYAYYYNLKKKSTGENLYNEFCKIVNDNMDKTGLSAIISKAVLSFRHFYKKELGLTECKLLNENWSFLKNVLPVYPYSGETKRPSIVKAFNTPFYPNTLIATSVLQEGVDLHYHCSEVIHYGIAWTPGDNEQRNGRVDRLFGKLHNDLKVNEKAVLPIRYPYLQNTLDQEQLQRFIFRKNSAEKLLDKLQNIETSKEIDLLENTDDWQEYFNTPKKNNEIEEPYAVNKNDFADIKEPISYSKSNISKLENSIDAILNTVIEKFGDEVKYKKNVNEKDTLLCAIKHIRKNGRHQPILIDLMYYEQGLSFINKSVYVLKIKTPLGKENLKLNQRTLETTGYYNNPIVKINYNSDDKSFFTYYVSSELPVFIDNKEGVNLSAEELIVGIKNVISFADDLENKLSNGQQDINNNIIKDSFEEVSNLGNEKLGKNRKTENISENWELSDDKKYLILRKKVNLHNNEEFTVNHKSLLYRVIGRCGNVFKEVGLFKDDALSSELELFEKIIKSR